jgi:hypothetical protein
MLVIGDHQKQLLAQKNVIEFSHYESFKLYKNSSNLYFLALYSHTHLSEEIRSCLKYRVMLVSIGTGRDILLLRYNKACLSCAHKSILCFTQTMYISLSHVMHCMSIQNLAVTVRVVTVNVCLKFNDNYNLCHRMVHYMN